MGSCLVIIFVLISSLLWASEIVLKSGEKVEGKILEQTDKYIKIDSGIGVDVTYYADEIDTVNGKKIQIIKPRPILGAQP